MGGAERQTLLTAIASLSAAAAVTAKDNAEMATAKTAGKVSSKDDSSSDEDVAAAMSKMSVNSPAVSSPSLCYPYHILKLTFATQT